MVVRGVAGLSFGEVLRLIKLAARPLTLSIRTEDDASAPPEDEARTLRVAFIEDGCVLDLPFHSVRRRCARLARARGGGRH